MTAGRDCPRCRGPVYRSHARSFVERLRKRFSAQRPFRCGRCDWRGWMTLVESGDYAPVDDLAPPDFVSLDSTMGAAPSPHEKNRETLDGV